MSDLCCTAATRDGRPCAARPLPGSDFCLFHDPRHQQELSRSRSKGGAAPRRRTRRYPLLLDYKHVAELLSELFVEALNEPAPLDAPRLRALTGLSTVLLKAVGRPKGTYEIHLDRTEPTPDEPCLLRIYPPEPPETTRLRAADAEIEADIDIETEIEAAGASPDPADLSCSCSTPTPNAQRPTPTSEQANEQGGNRTGTAPLATGFFTTISPGPAPPGPEQVKSQNANLKTSGKESSTSASSMSDASGNTSSVLCPGGAPEGSPGQGPGKRDLMADSPR